KWVLVGGLIGIVAGFGATIFYFAIQLVSNTVLGGITGFYPPNPAGEAAAPLTINPHFLLIPISTAIGGLIAGALIYGLAPEAEGHGTDAAIDAFHNKGGAIRHRAPIVKTIASAFTIGTGGSAGREGPTAQIAAGFGSMVGEIFGLSVRDRRIAVAAGIGAGIGSIFKSPFGGAILSAEILYSGGDIEAAALIPAFIATPLGYVIFGSFTGFTPIFGTSIQYIFNPLNLVLYALLGFLCAGVGRMYTMSFYSVKKFFDGFKIPRFARPMIGAAIAGVIGIFFPEVLGLGYGFLQFAINGDFNSISVNYVALPLSMILLLLILFKIFATSLTVGSGGSGGVFAPSLAIGGYLGALLWVVMHDFGLNLIPIPAPLVIVGMMALFAGVGRVPIAVILMVSEMTGNLTLLAPSMIAVVISYYFTGSKHTIYHNQVLTRAESPAHRGEYNIPLMTKLFVSDAMNKDVQSLDENDSVEKANQMMLEKGYKGIPIVSGGKVVGIVALSDVQLIPKEKSPATKLKEIMTRNVISIGPNETILEALRKMTANSIGRLPVVDQTTGSLLGIITRTDLFRAYDAAVSDNLLANGS
ncbi:MAG: chloride channel protein, partial [Nitrososphaerales archaeon]